MVILNRTNRILLVILFIAVVVAGYPWLKAYVAQNREVEPPFDLSDIEADRVNEIVIQEHGKDERRLVKEDDIWKIDGDGADPGKVRKFLEQFSGLTMDELAGKNPENHEDFGVTDDKGVRVNIKQGKKEFGYVVGSVGQTANSFYMRQEGSDEVYRVSGPVRDTVMHAADMWKPDSKEEKTEE